MGDAEGRRVIPKSNNQHRLAQNLDVTGFELTKESWTRLVGWIRVRFNDPPSVSDRNVSAVVECEIMY
jgi:diketogulonate reductase-like aldo/keto reductase